MVDLIKWLYSSEMAREGGYTENKWVCKILSYERHRRSTRSLVFARAFSMAVFPVCEFNHLDVNRL